MFSVLSEVPSMTVIKPKPRLEEGAQKPGQAAVEQDKDSGYLSVEQTMLVSVAMVKYLTMGAPLPFSIFLP